MSFINKKKVEFGLQNNKYNVTRISYLYDTLLSTE